MFAKQPQSSRIKEEEPMLRTTHTQTCKSCKVTIPIGKNDLCRECRRLQAASWRLEGLVANFSPIEIRFCAIVLSGVTSSTEIVRLMDLGQGGAEVTAARCAEMARDPAIEKLVSEAGSNVTALHADTATTRCRVCGSSINKLPCVLCITRHDLQYQQVLPSVLRKVAARLERMQ